LEQREIGSDGNLHKELSLGDVADDGAGMEMRWRADVTGGEHQLQHRRRYIRTRAHETLLQLSYKPNLD